MTPTARTAFRATLESKVPSDLARAERHFAQARSAHQQAADALQAARQAARQTNPNRSDESDIATELAAAHTTEADLKIARAELRRVREKFAGELAHIIRKEVVKLAPAFAKTTAEFTQVLALLAEADNFAASKGVQTPGYSGLVAQLEPLREFARQLAAGR